MRKQFQLMICLGSMITLLILITQNCFAASNRVALVIGNSSYKTMPLKNPRNDAADMASKLTQLDFDVDKLINADIRQMTRAIQRFGKKLHEKNTIGLFYFAGHGVQVKGSNYLLPLKANIETEADVEFEAVNAARILHQMEYAGNNLNLIILDACRNNPFARSFRSASRGLAKMEAPTGSMILYATSPGNVAADGQGRNGLFTEKLLETMDQRGLQIEDVFKQTAIAVSNASGKKQVPYIEGVILGDFYFLPNVKGNVFLSQRNEAVQSTSSQTEIVFWQSVEKQPSQAGYEAYLKQWPKGQFSVLANLRLDEISAKKEAVQEQSISKIKYNSAYFVGRKISGKTLRDATINIKIKTKRRATIDVELSNIMAKNFSENGIWYIEDQKYICFRFKRFNKGKRVCRYPVEKGRDIKLFPKDKDPNKPIWDIN